MFKKKERPEGVVVPYGPPPKTLHTSRTINEVTHVAGIGDRSADIMFIALQPNVDEVATEQQTGYGKPIRVKPRFLKGTSGSMMTNLLESNNIGLDKCYYTSLFKWLPKKSNKISKEQLNYALPTLLEEIAEVKPKIIVCLGKKVFDNFVDFKIAFTSILGGWFRNETHDCLIYPMDDSFKLALKPEVYEQFRIGMREVATMNRAMHGKGVPKVKLNYKVINTKQELQTYVDELAQEDVRLLSIDCEWHGTTHLDIDLRSMQIAKAPGEAVYIRFMDEDMNYVFDVDYKEAGSVLNQWMGKEFVKYVGHHCTADLLVIDHILGLPWYDKVFMDTEFAQQVVDESFPLKLERLAVAYTDLGRYDVELTLWKSRNKKLIETPDGRSGYGRVPDEILIPYACKDVDTCIRAWPILAMELERQKLTDYYFNLFNPFVSNVFTVFSKYGLPINVKKLDELRDIYTYSRDLLLSLFRKNVYQEALDFAEELLGDNEISALFLDSISEGNTQEAVNLATKHLGAEFRLPVEHLTAHIQDAPIFNIRSRKHMCRWLFDVKKYTPIKSTKAEGKGLSSIPWERVTDLPKSKQKEYAPATDSQTIKILAAAHDDELLTQLVHLNAVGNICKAFLKEADKDMNMDTIKENGIHAWIAEDNRLHGMYSTTETGRPRGWNPNTLNLPGWVNNNIVAGMEAALASVTEEEMPKHLRKFKTEKIPSIRACVEMDDGWCCVESDYATAELRGQGFISKDPKMIRLFEEKDPCFVMVAKEGGDPLPVRVSYAEDSGIIIANQKKEYLMAEVVEGVIKQTFDGGDILRDDNLEYVHYKYDLHWSLAEMVHGKPREELSNKADRGAAKTGNFASAYGATGPTLERKIEEDTGIKPKDGTGDALLEALRKRQTIAIEFLEYLETLPKNPGYYRAASGRIRHFHILDEEMCSNSYEREMSTRGVGREARNFPFQESVAATAARASNWMLTFARVNNLKGMPMIVLYDAMVVNCPEKERFVWYYAHQLFMFLCNGWRYGERVLRYPIDTDMSKAWSTKPTKEYAKLLADRSYENDDARMHQIEKKLKEVCEIYEPNEELALNIDVMKMGLFPVKTN